MFEAKSLLFIYVETPLHAGTGRGLGALDLPIQRERTTQYPIVQASSLKGRLRAACRESGMKPDDLKVIFGPDPRIDQTQKPDEHAGALSTGDARLLLFPVRSLAGVFAWTTSVDALARFRREAEIAESKPKPDWGLPPEPDGRSSQCWVNGTTLKAGESVVLEEFSFTPDQAHADTVKKIGEWLEDRALPETGYDYWKKALPEKLCILPEDAFRDFVLYATEVQTHIALNPKTKTVDTEKGALWTSESLPVDTLLYTPLMATQSRANNGVKMSGHDILQKIIHLKLDRTQLGGDETTGQGWVALRFAGGAQ
jgi:CRISPR-associated protein Cmr4